MRRNELRSIRLSLGLTQERFAALIGVGLRTYCRWESGAQKPGKAAEKAIKYVILELSRGVK